LERVDDYRSPLENLERPTTVYEVLADATVSFIKQSA